ncbi:hypothetical protein [Terrabacter terrigena]|uniref:Lipoprotein n=1 Tax=Terrabacter terrigena TaxID=574718 RepID=A0ABW3N161_9MICO
MRVRGALVAVGAVAAVSLLTGCADEMEGAMAETVSGSTSAALVCAADAKPVDLPEGFPAQAALPDGMVVTGVQARTQGRTVVTAVSPKPFAQTLEDMQHAYTTRGWTASEGEVEDRDAESNFDGNGLRGRWAIREIPDCTGNTSVSVLLGK